MCDKNNNIHNEDKIKKWKNDSGTCPLNNANVHHINYSTNKPINFLDNIDELYETKSETKNVANNFDDDKFTPLFVFTTPPLIIRNVDIEKNGPNNFHKEIANMVYKFQQNKTECDAKSPPVTEYHFIPNNITQNTTYSSSSADYDSIPETEDVCTQTVENNFSKSTSTSDLEYPPNSDYVDNAFTPTDKKHLMSCTVSKGTSTTDIEYPPNSDFVNNAFTPIDENSLISNFVVNKSTSTSDIENLPNSYYNYGENASTPTDKNSFSKSTSTSDLDYPPKYVESTPNSDYYDVESSSSHDDVTDDPRTKRKIVQHIGYKSALASDISSKYIQRKTRESDVGSYEQKPSTSSEPKQSVFQSKYEEWMRSYVARLLKRSNEQVEFIAAVKNDVELTPDERETFLEVFNESDDLLRPPSQPKEKPKFKQRFSKMFKKKSKNEEEAYTMESTREILDRYEVSKKTTEPPQNILNEMHAYFDVYVRDYLFTWNRWTLLHLNHIHADHVKWMEKVLSSKELTDDNKAAILHFLDGNREPLEKLLRREQFSSNQAWYTKPGSSKQ